jgi:hypothetical protein
MSLSESETEESRENASNLPRKADLEGQFTRRARGRGWQIERLPSVDGKAQLADDA